MDKSAISAPILAWLALILYTNSSALSTIVMRKIKTIHWISMNLYLNMTTIVVLSIVIHAK